ncbi:phosphatidate cytidylyltransferase [Arthrobacter sp. MYb213]|uniref:phosphatidate cytidylyltransferase n=1 Tax=Arthrobacter sp. MYb213 TaxID=1848595 RepID=UPI00256FAE9C|nr:phosphatidate cytidylyltransferase [Arthrobacter sp. MYb213]
MPGSTDNTEGNASAVPSVASGENQPMTRREARAQREAAERGNSRASKLKRALSGEKSESVKPQASPPSTPETVPPQTPVATPKSIEPQAEAKVKIPVGEKPKPKDHAAPKPVPVIRPENVKAPVDTPGTSKPEQKTQQPVTPVAKPEPVQAPKPLNDATKSKAKAEAKAQLLVPVPATDRSVEKTQTSNSPVEAIPAPPHSDSKDLAETGHAEPEEAEIPAELLIGGPPKKSRAGRNLPAAIGVGLGMLGLAMVGLFWVPALLVALIVVLAGIGSWEVARATTYAKTEVQQFPLYLASVLLPVSAILGGLDALSFAYLGSLVLALVFRILDGLKGAVASVMSSVFIISWVPLLLSFALLVMRGDNGNLLITTILLLVVSNDTFGYAVGVLFGKHPMAPKISPKKSWEGFAGSMVGSMVIGALAANYWLDMPWWSGVILACFTTIAATTGDFAESMVKRELGIKDMSNLLPGHGGIMDRLDSLLFAIPLAYLVSHFLEWSVAVF